MTASYIYIDEKPVQINNQAHKNISRFEGILAEQ